MDEETANKSDANSEVNVPANRKEYMRELMRKKRAAEKVRVEQQESREGGLDASGVVVDTEPMTEAVAVNLTRTDRKFENDRPGYYIFGGEVKERECWRCGEPFKTRMELNKFCSPRCKDGYLDEAFGKMKGVKG